MSRNICLHIGINAYDGYAPGSDLPGSVNDAWAWHGLMRDSGVDDVQNTVLVDGQATRRAIRHAIEALGAAVGADGNSGLITFSGHGVATSDAGVDGIGVTAAICPSDVPGKSSWSGT